ncbi:MAG TPA: tetratricopeptide repeat protein, partial [Pyrinomonadaceae bacterium]|nr:tetratricopeptide repeat protein [Pyrinomonadaceae bacterium]
MKGTPFKTDALAAALALLALLSTLPAVAAAWQDEPPQKTGAHADAEVERGRQLYLRGENARAVKTLGDAANRLKTDADAWHYYGLALNRAGKSKEAVKAFERAAKLRGSAGDRAALSLALLLSGRRGEAELEARRALELDPELPDAHFVVGMTLFAAEKFERAIEHADEALRLRPDFGAAQYLKGQAVLYIYADESDRVALKYPLRPGAEPAQRAAALGAREREFAPLVARMREAAARMEEFVNSQPNHPDAPAWRELVGTLRVYGRERRP